MTSRNFFSRLSAPVGQSVLFAGLLVCLTMGCTRAVDGPERFDVSGTVQFKGEPVPVGTVRFLPDASNGNSGPAGFASIKDGKYDTAKDGRGTVGGPHEITVIGFDGQAEPENELTEGRSLFSEYRMLADLASEKSTKDIEVPSAK
ncbi:MAG: hypothetical protein WD045_03320 [Pirellulaceae bacterium]